MQMCFLLFCLTVPLLSHVKDALHILPLTCENYYFSTLGQLLRICANSTQVLYTIINGLEDETATVGFNVWDVSLVTPNGIQVSFGPCSFSSSSSSFLSASLLIPLFYQDGLTRHPWLDWISPPR